MKSANLFLFKDMQAEFRSTTHLSAEKTRLESEKAMAEQRATHEEHLAKLQAKSAVAKKESHYEELNQVEKMKGESTLQRERNETALQAQRRIVAEEELASKQKLELAQKK